MADENIKRLDRLVSELLDYSRIEKGAVHLIKDNHDICSIVNNILTSMKEQGNLKQLKITSHFQKEPFICCIDKDKMTQVFTNLIYNAVKFTPEGGKIDIYIKHLEIEDLIQVTVEDTGIGIDKDDIPKLFKQFVQINRIEGSGSKGTGLGLAIVKGIITAHEGTIHIESTLNQGSKFIFTLPYKGEKSDGKKNINHR